MSFATLQDTCSMGEVPIPTRGNMIPVEQSLAQSEGILRTRESYGMRMSKADFPMPFYYFVPILESKP